MKTLALLIAGIMTLSACGQKTNDTNSSKPAESTSKATESAAKESASEAVEESKWPEYLNMDSTYPVIKDEYEGTIKLSMAIMIQDPAVNEWDELWTAKYLKDKYNIELEVEYIQQSALSERKNLMMNSGELPDLMWNMNFSTDELARYGAQEGLLLACDEYISEELTPNMYSYINEYESFLKTSDGHIYSLPRIDDPTENMLSYNRYFVNGEYLAAAGIESPRTLDEFTDAMYRLKEADVTGVGSDNFYPIGGGMEVRSITPYLLRALGYNTEWDTYGFSPALKNGEVVIPVYDMDTYQEFLKLMNQYYNDGIINKNYFTIEQTETDAQLQSGKTGVYGTVVYTTGLETWSEWEALYPLTSEWNDTPVAYDRAPIKVGGFVISAETEYPELCMRLADIFYDITDCRAFWGGTGEGSEYDYEGYVLAEWIPEKNNYGVNAEKLPEGYSGYNYLIQVVHGTMLGFGTYGLREAIVNMAAANGGDLPYDVRETYDVEGTSDHQWRAELWEKVVDYCQYGYPSIYYVDDKVSGEILDLKTVIEPYVKEQVALFITGGRDLSEVDKFKTELESMGMDRLLEIYQDIYSSMN